MNDTTAPVDSATSSAQRKSYRLALFVGAVATLLFFLLFAKGRAPASVVDLLSSDSVTEIDIHGGSRIEFSVANGQADAEMMAAVSEAMRAGGATVAQSQNSKISLDFVETDLTAAKVWAERVASGGRLSMQMVIEDSEFMKGAYALALEKGDALGIAADIDQWQHSESGASYIDYYLLADTRETLEAGVKHWLDSGALVLPPGTMLAYEEFSYWNEGVQQGIRWRSYLLNSTKELTNKDIAEASVFWDQMTNKPEVLVELTMEGRKKFADLTGANVGKKVAILLGANINSAPSIQARIEGGRTTISMGGNDAKTMQAEAQSLVAVFSSPELPVEVSVISVEAVQAHVSPFKLRMARLLMALLVGVCIALPTLLLAIVLGRVTRLTPYVVVSRTKGQRQWFTTLRPLLVSLSGVVVVLVLGTLWLPGTEEIFGGILLTSDATGTTRQVSWVALGLAPFLSGAVLAEGIAFLIPPWRRRRHGGAARRAPIKNLALGLGLVMLATQAFFVTRWLGSFDQGFYEVGVASLSQFRFSERAVLMALLGGSALLYIIAKLISRYGLGNGYAVVLLAGALPRLPEFLDQARALSSANAFAFVKAFLLVALALVGSTLMILRTFQLRTGRFTLTLTGVAPLLIAPAMLGVILIASRDGQFEEALLQAESSIQKMQLISVALASILITAFALRSSSSQIRVVAGSKSEGDFQSQAIAIAISLAYPLGLYYLVTSITELGITIISLSTLVLVPALALDLAGEFRARFRNPELVPIWQLQRPAALMPLTEALANADIECFVRGRYLRTLLSVVGPFVPMGIWVSKEKAAEARELIQGQI